jgi:DNA adenine methylase
VVDLSTEIHACGAVGYDSQPSVRTPQIDLPAGRSMAVPRPFLKWAGSKQALLHHLVPHIPETYGRYYEPFLGSGALFFHLKPRRATLGDYGSELVETWEAIGADVERIIDHLSIQEVSKDSFYRIREGRSTDKIIRAAELIYLNKTCWNGLYRVNSAGKFNVPYGQPGNVNVCDAANLRACAKQISQHGVTIRQGDFASTLRPARGGDLVFLDPPYVTSHNKNGFRDYNERLFRWDDQIRLSKTAEKLRLRGARVIVSNANHPDVIALYPNFKSHVIQRSSTLSSNPQHRGKVTEVVLVG